MLLCLNFLVIFLSFPGKFSPQELDDLQTEFTHHKDKLREYNRLLKVLTDHDGISDNSVFSRNEIRDKELEKLREKLEDTHEMLRKSFSRLKEKTTGEKEEGLFRDSRVTELWQRAQNGKFTKEELESIKVQSKFSKQASDCLVFLTAIVWGREHCMMSPNNGCKGD